MPGSANLGWNVRKYNHSMQFAKLKKKMLTEVWRKRKQFSLQTARLTHKKQDLVFQQYLHPAQEPKASGNHSSSLHKSRKPRENSRLAHLLISPLNSAGVEHLARENDEPIIAGLLSLASRPNGTSSEAFTAELITILEKKEAFPSHCVYLVFTLAIH